MGPQKIVLVTGSNQGLGLAIVRVAATRDPSAHYILACRSLERGENAIAELKQKGVAASIELMQLDVTKDDDITRTVESITATHGKLDGENNTLVDIHSTRMGSNFSSSLGQ